MPDKSFERTVPFVEVKDVGWYPLIRVAFLKPNKQRLELSLLFDTGADLICLHPDWEWAFPNLAEFDFDGIGGNAKGKHTLGQIELFGEVIDCDIGFGPKEMQSRTWMAGVIGRECFKSFGFGFWEGARELYVTLKP